MSTRVFSSILLLKLSDLEVLNSPTYLLSNTLTHLVSHPPTESQPSIEPDPNLSLKTYHHSIFNPKLQSRRLTPNAQVPIIFKTRSNVKLTNYLKESRVPMKVASGEYYQSGMISVHRDVRTNLLRCTTH